MDLPFTSCFQGKVKPLNFKKKTFDISPFFDHNNAAFSCYDEENDVFEGENEALARPPESLDLLVGKLVD